MTEHSTALLKEIAENAATPAAADAPEFIPADAPFTDEQRVWLDGLFTGLYALAKSSGGAAADTGPQTALKILYGSQSGTSEALSKQLKKHAATQGFDASIADLDSTSPAELAAMNHVLIVAATFGEGEPTDNAQNFYAALMADDAPTLPETLNFSVLGMGDSSYPHFNTAGRDIDARLAELGATR
ncbi:MAG: flavodoxin domain-containing protein, partial [Pseudomonadota bacterium]